MLSVSSITISYSSIFFLTSLVQDEAVVDTLTVETTAGPAGVVEEAEVTPTPRTITNDSKEEEEEEVEDLATTTMDTTNKTGMFSIHNKIGQKIHRKR